MKRIGINTRESLNSSFHFEEILEFLNTEKKEVFLSEKAQKNTKGKWDKLEKNTDIDLMIVFGGDGTILSTIRTMTNVETPLFGINGGNLGFLSSTSPENAKNALQDIFAGKQKEDRRSLLDIMVKKKNRESLSFQALNECAIHYLGISRLIEIEALVNDECLTNYRADGIIISTPTGSTAYNLAAGGPIVTPSIEAIMMTPIAPSSFGQKPIIIPSDKTITLLPAKKREKMILSVDGQESISLTSGDKIIIQQSQKKALFLRLPEESYFQNIREKLGWGE